jgi:hypothetical protein
VHGRKVSKFERNREICRLGVFRNAGTYLEIRW